MVGSNCVILTISFAVNSCAESVVTNNVELCTMIETSITAAVNLVCL